MNDKFAYYTVTARFATIEKEVEKSAKISINSFANDKTIDTGILSRLLPSGSKPSNCINAIIADFVNECKKYDSVSDMYNRAPFLFAEHYFYYKLLDDYNKKRDKKMSKDPFFKTKLNDYRKKFLGKEKKNLTQINNLFSQKEMPNLSIIIQICIDANTADLSQHGAKAYNNTSEILHGDSSKVEEFISRHKDQDFNISIIVDNTGIELLNDLLLAIYLLDKDLVKTVTFHAKVFPMYVSDVIFNPNGYGDDFSQLTDFLEKNILCSEYKDSIETFIGRYKELLDDKKILIKPNALWNMPFAFNESENMRKAFDSAMEGCSDLIIVKGDLNYRKLVGDKHWRYDKTFSSALREYKYSVLAIRAIKSSVIIGATQEQASTVRNNLNGYDAKYGQVQFYEKKKKKSDFLDTGAINSLQVTSDSHIMAGHGEVDK
ncbi:MAG: ARMT1-like domain-containing protein [Rikenellaceae bacterium]